MRLGLFGGLRISDSARSVDVSGAMQLAVLFRLAVDAGTAVSYRAIAEDIWGRDAPENTRAALQSIVSRLRSQLPEGVIESTTGGYRLLVSRSDVDALAFTDLVAAASAAPDQAAAARLASEALTLWTGEPWIPSENFDWFAADLARDRDQALRLGGAVATPARSSIPAPLTTLVGRERELATIADQLATNRLVTIIGTGGAGKTRLAIESAREHGNAILVELAPVSAPEVLTAVLAASGRELRTTEAVSEPTGNRERVLDSLGGREVLLVLDNCEHVIRAAADLAADLLAALPHLRILATSREPLGLIGEAFVPIGALEHPAESQLSNDLDLGTYAAVRLFAQRAASASGAELSADELVTAARICARLDGLPLALELAAAKVRTMSIGEVLLGLEDRFSLLTGGFRSSLPRHQTLRAMIDWSWSILTPEERTVLSRFSVYPGGADTKDVPNRAVFDSLVDRSLLQRVNGRFRALETIREYGIERLSEAGELADARADQVRTVAAAAARHEPLVRGPGVFEAIAWFDAEEDNIAGALRYAVQAGMAEDAVAILTACAWYWVIRDRQMDAREWVVAVAPLADTLDTEEARLVQLIFPVMAAFGGTDDNRIEDDAGRLPELVAGLRELADVKVDSNSFELLQLVVPVLDAYTAEGFDEGWMIRVRVPRGEELGLAPWPTAVLNVVRAAVAQNRGDVDELGEASELAVDQFSAIGDWWGLAFSQQMRSEWLAVTGQLEEAFVMAEASTESMRKITSTWDLAQQQGLAVNLLVRLGRFDDARARLAQMIADSDATGNLRTIVQVHTTALAAYVALGDRDPARASLDRLDALIRDIPRLPAQSIAWADAGRAGVAMLEGDYDAAERALRSAVDAALESHDHPVIGAVALALGTLALKRGDVAEAMRALDLSTAIIGIFDATNPEVIAIVTGAQEHGIGRADETPTRPGALESLKQLAQG